MSNPFPLIEAAKSTGHKDSPEPTAGELKTPSQASSRSVDEAEVTATRTPLPDLRLSNLRRNSIVAIICLSNFADVFSFYAALPGLYLMEQDLGMSVAKGSWYLAAPALGVACTSLIGGRLADVFGAKLVYMLGTLLFIASAVGGALSQNPLQVLLFRGLQGGATGLQIPSGLRGLMQTVPDPKDQRRALAVFSGGVSLGAAIGPMAGAGLCALSWRACYWVCVGFGGAILFGGIWIIPSLPAAEKDKRPSLDVLGLVLITGSLFGLVFGISQASTIHTFGSASVLVPICLSVPLLIIFFWLESRIPLQRDCLIPPSTWKIINFVPLMAVSSMPYFAWNASLFPLMVFWREVWGWSALSLALHLLPCGIACLALTAYATVYEHHFKLHLQFFVVICILASIVASVLASFADRPDKYWPLEFPSLVLLPFGCVGLQTCCYCGLSSSPPAMAGVVAALNNVSLQVGVAVFVSSAGLIQSSVDAKQPDGTSSYEGVAWACRFQVCLAAVVLGVFILLYRTPPALMTADRVGDELGEGLEQGTFASSSKKEKAGDTA